MSRRGPPCAEHLMCCAGPTPPDDPDFQLVLPKGYSEKFNEQIASLPESKRILVQGTCRSEGRHACNDRQEIRLNRFSNHAGQ
jgi:hypothetical protein